MPRKVYFENLDGLRFLCFLSVFLYHSFHTEYAWMRETEIYSFIKYGIFGNGNIGVNFFFVLSGFLITYLLIEEKKQNGRIHIGRFWMRRVLRIWPLFYVCVLIGFFGFPLLKSMLGQTASETAHIVNYLTFTNNFDFIAHGLPDASILGVLWSVAIEEQFYLLWPLILFALPVRHYWMPFTLIIAISLGFRASHDSVLMQEYHTLSCIGDMAVGAFGAWLVIGQQGFRTAMERLRKWQIVVLYALFACMFFMRDELCQASYFMRVADRLLIALLVLGIILEQIYAGNSFFKMSRFRRISRLGNITYGLYCLHFVGILLVTNATKILGVNTELWQVLILETSLALGVSIWISQLSYRFFEQPFLKLKDRFHYLAPRTKGIRLPMPGAAPVPAEELQPQQLREA